MITWKFTDESNVDTTGSQGAALAGPSEAVLENPRVKVVLGLLGETQTRVGDALKNVVVVLRNSEHRRRRVRHVPMEKSKCLGSCGFLKIYAGKTLTMRHQRPTD